jgi:hypothetical protein
MSISANDPSSRLSALLGFALLADTLWDLASGRHRSQPRVSPETDVGSTDTMSATRPATDYAHAGSKPSKITILPTADSAGAKPVEALGGVTADEYAPGKDVTMALGEARMLLSYAASAGIPIGSEITGPIAQARAAQETRNWTPEIESKFWPALSRLAAAVKPVTAQSLLADEKGDAREATNGYFKWTMIIGAVIVPISIIMFVNTSVSNEIGDLLKSNDAAIVSLHDELLNYRSSVDRLAQTMPRTGEGSATLPSSAAPSRNDIVEKLAQFARVSRLLFARAQIMNGFILWREQEPGWAQGDKPWWAIEDTEVSKDSKKQRDNLELDVQLGNDQNGEKSLQDQGFSKLATYQDIRAFAKSVQQWNLVIYGAITAYLLPIAYALLGACAFALRNLSAQTKAKAYQPSYANFARIVIALIAGTVVGLFNDFTKGVSVSPLAVAFLVGYAVEVFFSFLDAFVQTFRKVRA